MRFIKLTIAYVGKNFLYLSLLALIPAIFLGLTINPFQPIEFIYSYSQTPVVAFATIFKGLFPFGMLEMFLLLVSALLIAIFVSAILGQIEQHFRSGKLNLGAIKEHVNNNVLIVFANIALLFVVSFVLFFAGSAILFFVHLLLSGINTSPTVLNIIISNIIISLLFVVLAIFAHIIFLNMANMITNGTQLKDSLSETIKLSQKNTFNLSLATIAPFILVVVLISLFYGSAVLPVVNVISVLGLIVYYSSLSMISYFELSKLDRFDNRKKYYRK